MPAEWRPSGDHMVDRFICFSVAVPIQNIPTEIMVQSLVYHWISFFEVPATILMDQGMQFGFIPFNEVTVLLGTRRLWTAAYYPQANGMVDRLHQIIKTSLMAQSDFHNRARYIALILVSIHTMI